MAAVGDRRETGCERMRHSEHGRGHGVGDRGSLGVGEPNNELWLLVTIMTAADAAVAAAGPWRRQVWPPLRDMIEQFRTSRNPAWLKYQSVWRRWRHGVQYDDATVSAPPCLHESFRPTPC